MYRIHNIVRLDTRWGLGLILIQNGGKMKKKYLDSTQNLAIESWWKEFFWIFAHPYLHFESDIITLTSWQNMTIFNSDLHMYT